MNDDHPSYSPYKRAAPPRQPQPDEYLWTLTRGTERRRAEVRDFHDLGAELQIYVNDEFVSAQRYPTRALAALAGNAIREAYEHEGWKRG